MVNEKTDNLSRSGTDPGNPCPDWGGNFDFNTDVFLSHRLPVPGLQSRVTCLFDWRQATGARQTHLRKEAIVEEKEKRKEVKAGDK